VGGKSLGIKILKEREKYIKKMKEKENWLYYILICPCHTFLNLLTEISMLSIFSTHKSSSSLQLISHSFCPLYLSGAEFSD
jgi:hypothetical protein